MDDKQVKLFSLDDMWGITGRLSRLHFLLLFVRLYALMVLATTFIAPIFVFAATALGVSPKIAMLVAFGLVYGLSGLSLLSMSMRRLQDIGYAYWWILIFIATLFCIPNQGYFLTYLPALLLSGLLIFLASMPPEREENAFGDEVDNPDVKHAHRWFAPSTQGVAIFGGIFFMAICVFSLMVPFMPAEVRDQILQSVMEQSGTGPLYTPPEGVSDEQVEKFIIQP